MTTASDLLQRCREFYLDDAEPDYLWPDDYLLTALNDAEREACERQRLLEDETTASVCQISMASGTATYTLNSSIVLVDQIRLANGTLLAKKTVDELDADSSVWRTATGTPTSYVCHNQTILVTPIPDDDDDGDKLYLSVWRRPITKITVDDSPEIAAEYHEHLLDWVCFRAYMRRDEDTFNPELAAAHRALFDERFGPPIPAGVREHQRRSPKSLRLRPTPYIATSITTDSDDDDD